MSSPDEVSFRGTNWGPESGEHTERRRFAHGFPRGHGPGPGPEEKVCLQVSRPPQYDSWLDREEMDGRSVIWGCEGRPGTPVDDRGDNLDFVQQLAIEGTSFGQHIASTVAPAPVAVASAGLYKISPRKKPAQEKPSQWDTSRGPVARIFPPWGQRLKSATVEPATFPPISGVALLGKASKCSLPSGPKEFKSVCTGKKSIAKKTREPQVPLHRAEQPSVCMHRGEMSSGDSNTRAPQVPANPQFFLIQRCARPRAPPAPAGDQELPLRLPFPVGDRQHQIQAIGGCQQCEMLQKEIDELKEQLAIMQVFKEKFQDP